eukprot:4370755-Pyramimonas_sp.AAC.1
MGGLAVYLTRNLTDNSKAIQNIGALLGLQEGRGLLRALVGVRVSVGAGPDLLPILKNMLQLALGS